MAAVDPWVYAKLNEALRDDPIWSNANPKQRMPMETLQHLRACLIRVMDGLDSGHLSPLRTAESLRSIVDTLDSMTNHRFVEPKSARRHGPAFTLGGDPIP